MIGSYTNKVDIWSFGAVLFKMCYNITI